MSSFFWKILSKFTLFLLSLRYKIKVEGLETLEKLSSDRGILFLPNHPAHMDPLFLYLLLWPKFRMHPVVIEYIYRLSILKPFMKLVGAVAVPSLDSSINPLKVKKANEAIQAIAEGIKRGENYLLYPGGRLKTTGKEVLGGSSGAHSLLQECPETQVVLIRTTGLWGSSFSRAILGRSPDLPSTLLQGFKTLLKNGIFFSPRRKVKIEISALPKDLPKDKGRLVLNRYLENWYNHYLSKEGKYLEVEPVELVSYSFWKKDLLTPFVPRSKKEGASSEVSEETKVKVYAEIRKILAAPEISIEPNMHLAIDLGMDSLNIAELAAFLLKSYQVDEIHPEDMETVQSILEIAEGARQTEKSSKQERKFSWPLQDEKDRPIPLAPEGKTLGEAFLHSCERMKGFIACGDDVIGSMSYRKLKQSALVLSRYFAKFPEERVGVMLPATTATYLVILALFFAGKVPVMLNWTLGPRYLDEMMKLSGIQKVISSWKFLDRLSHVDLGGVIDHLLLLEDVRKELSFFDKIKGVFLSKLSVKSCISRLGIDRLTGDEIAVILFTSGTEASPKGVPLTHKNILSNQRSAMQCITFENKDVLYGILPPFHSFGFSVAGLFPLCGGIKVAFYPDPTDATALAEGVHRWKITLFCAPPSFLKGLFRVAKEEQLQTIRYFVCGAEKTSQELIDRVSKLPNHPQILEGYGITECSPILSLTRPFLPHLGVGQPLADVEMRMIHVETKEPLSYGMEGEICVRGPNVFQGYLDPKANPFIEIEGKLWYRTGDIGYFDEKQNLILSGRMKRFTKLGGEMISLGALEDALSRQLIQEGKISPDLPSIALIADEKEVGKPQLILFITTFLDREEANEILRVAGFSRLAKISSVRRVEEIPLMGTGKTDYRKLQSYVA